MLQSRWKGAPGGTGSGLVTLPSVHPQVALKLSFELLIMLSPSMHQQGRLVPHVTHSSPGALFLFPTLDASCSLYSPPPDTCPWLPLVEPCPGKHFSSEEFQSSQSWCPEASVTLYILACLSWVGLLALRGYSVSCNFLHPLLEVLPPQTWETLHILAWSQAELWQERGVFLTHFFAHLSGVGLGRWYLICLLQVQD